MSGRVRLGAAALSVTAIGLSLMIPPAVAGKKVRTLDGTISPSGTMQLSTWVGNFTKKQGGGQFRAFRWRFDGVPLQCESGSAIYARPVKGGFRIRKRYAKGGGWGVGQGAGDFAEFVSGSLKLEDLTAKGTVQVSGGELPLVSGGVGTCDSGELSWTAGAG
jgi:hypothetical protein